MTDNWTERLSEYVDNELSTTDTEALEAHLLECAECGRVVQELRAVVARAGQVIDRPPQRDLWADIANRIAQPESERVADKRRFTFSLSQLAAASVVLMLLSGGAMYLMLSKRTVSPTEVAVGTPARNPVTTEEAIRNPVNVKSPAAENYNVAIHELEVALANRADLDTATVRVLTTNLRTIDGAIGEARAALGRDPGNMYLNRYLDETMQRKIQLLRRATGILRAQT